MRLRCSQWSPKVCRTNRSRPGWSSPTVRWGITSPHIYDKIGVTTRAGATLYARTKTPTRLDVEALFGALCQAWNAGTTTEIDIASVRELAPGLAVVDGWQTISGPLPRMHLTAIVRAEGDAAQVVECRPYVLLELPSDG